MCSGPSCRLPVGDVLAELGLLSDLGQLSGDYFLFRIPVRSAGVRAGSEGDAAGDAAPRMGRMLGGSLGKVSGFQMI